MSSLSAPKLSEVLQTLSEQSDDFDNYENACGDIQSSDDRTNSKQNFTDAVNYCMVLLSKTNRLTNHRSEVLSDEATLMGHEMFERIISVDVQMDVETEDMNLSSDFERQIKVEPQEYVNGLSNIHIHAYSLATGETTSITSPPSSPLFEGPMKNTENISTPSTHRSLRSKRKSLENPREKTIRDFFSPLKNLSSKNSPNDFDDKLPPSPVSLTGNDDIADFSEQQKSKKPQTFRRYGIPLEIKIKTVALARAHPTWSLKKLQEKGSMYLKCMDQLKQWERQVDNGGTNRDKFYNINVRTYERYCEARSRSQRVTGIILQNWAVQVAKELYGTEFRFEASTRWLFNFKKTYGLYRNESHGGLVNKDESITHQTQEGSFNKKQRLETENNHRFM